AIVDHVLAAEVAYARKLGLRWRQPALGDRDGTSGLRASIVETLSRPSAGTPLVEKGWPPRYAARRVAWHVLDHARGIADRSAPATAGRARGHPRARRRPAAARAGGRRTRTRRPGHGRSRGRPRARRRGRTGCSACRHPVALRARCRGPPRLGAGSTAGGGG